MRWAIFLAALTAFTSTSVFADGSSAGSSEYQWQTLAGKFEIEPFLRLSRRKLDYKANSGTYDQTITGIGLGSKFSYGINEMFSVDARLSYLKEKDEVSNPSGGGRDPEFKGLEDLELNFLGRIGLGAGSFRFGTGLSISPGDSVVEDNSDSNQYSGGHMLIPFVGYEMSLLSGTAGARLSHEIRLGEATQKIKDDDGTTEKDKITGFEATTFSLFYENEVTPMVTVGGSLYANGYSRMESKDETGSKFKLSGVTETHLKIYVPVRLKSDLTLLPEVDVWQATAHSGYLESYGGSSLSMAARFGF
jgi:hypothetical protein